MIASGQGNNDFCKLLLDSGADREITNHNGKTALDFAREAPEWRKAACKRVIELLEVLDILATFT